MAPSVTEVSYRPISLPAILGLGLGLCAGLAWISPILWIVPVAGIVLNGYALRSIRHSEPPPIGRPAALLGLALSVLFAVAAPTRAASHAWLLNRQAREIGLEWLELVRQGDVHQAHQWTLSAARRSAALPEFLWDYYRQMSEPQQELRTFVRDPLIHWLAAAGPRAEIRFWGTEGSQQRSGSQQVSQLYTVTFDRDGQKTTFLVRLVLDRSWRPESARHPWRVADYVGGARPQASFPR